MAPLRFDADIAYARRCDIIPALTSVRPATGRVAVQDRAAGASDPDAAGMAVTMSQGRERMSQRYLKTMAKSLLAAAAPAMLAACADVHAPLRPPERGDGGAPSLTVDQSIRQSSVRRTRDRVDASPDAVRDVDRRTYVSPRGSGGSGPSGGYVGAAPGLPSIPIRPDATTIPLPGRTTFPLPGGTTIPTPMDPLSPNPATVTFPPPAR
jgi:hypothetical protein